MSNTFLGLDRSGNDNNWTVNNLTLAADQMLDSPTNNFATFNIIARRNDVTTLPTFSEGNLKGTFPNAGGNVTFGVGTIPSKSGKYYYELLINNYSSNVMIAIGTQNDLDAVSNTLVNYQANDGTIRKYNTIIVNASTCTTGDIVGCAYDLDNGTVKFYKNGALEGTVTGITDYHYFPFTRGSTSDVTTINFGQDSSFAGAKTAQGNQDGNEIGDFYYTPPTGFLALCTSNLPSPAVYPNSHFNTVLYTGNNSTQSITGFGFQPDWIWDKSRNQTGSHMLVDAVRGVGKYLRTNTSDAEVDDASVLTSFDSDGVTVGDINGNATSSSSVMWGWKANGSGSSNTDGSITSTVSANQDAGFSIVSYAGNDISGATIGHGLSKKPEFIIVKARDNSAQTESWSTYNVVSGATKYIFLNSDGAAGTYTPTWNDTEPTSSVFSVGNYTGTNNDTDNYIAYCFHSVDGYSKMDSYKGNGDADGTFVNTGFRPAFVLFKRTDISNNWLIFDSARNTYNNLGERLYPNEDSAGSDYDYLDFTSNGFKLRYSGEFNTNQLIYLAFAETPFKYANAR